MARVGFKKTYPEGALNKAAMQSLFTHLRTFIANAGFNVLLDSADGIDFIRMGSPAGTANDDIPHWALGLQGDDTSESLIAHPVFGNNFLDASAHAPTYTVFNSDWPGDPIPEITVWFAADGLAGWWWMHAVKPQVTSFAGVKRVFACAGVTSRRYPSDTHQGLCARYGLWDAQGNWQPAYAVNTEGMIKNGRFWQGAWSPFGQGWYNAGYRHPGSPLTKMAVPLFPSRDDGITACVLGEFNELLIITDGYALEEEVVPGWVAMIGDREDQHYAVPAPASFTVL